MRGQMLPPMKVANFGEQYWENGDANGAEILRGSGSSS